jgi:methylmalonyl-CoA/ethylmalonyl-CoA epimerase
MAVRNIHHVGIAVADIDGALETYVSLFGAALEHREQFDEQGVDAVSLRVGESRIELLGSLGPDTPVGKFLDKRGPGLHHLAFEVDDIVAELRRLAAAGAELIDDEPRRGTFGTTVAFVHPHATDGVLAELVANV